VADVKVTGSFRTLDFSRLSCHRFRSNEVGLRFSVIAYNLGNLWRRLALPKKDRELVADESATRVGDDGRATGEACPLLLAPTGGRTSEPVAVRGDAGPHRAATGMDGIGREWPSQQRNLSTKGRERRGDAKVGWNPGSSRP
jgi:hypothetical protein